MKALQNFLSAVCIPAIFFFRSSERKQKQQLFRMISVACQDKWYWMFMHAVTKQLEGHFQMTIVQIIMYQNTWFYNRIYKSGSENDINHMRLSNPRESKIHCAVRQILQMTMFGRYISHPIIRILASSQRQQNQYRKWAFFSVAIGMKCTSSTQLKIGKICRIDWRNCQKYPLFPPKINKHQLLFKILNYAN